VARLNGGAPERQHLLVEAGSAGRSGDRLSRLEPFFVVAGVILAAGTFAGSYAVRGTTWVVMTDELQTTKLASSIAETGSLVPRIHGRYYAALSQLYPLLIAPFYGLMTPPDAATAAHAMNAFLLASAAWPAYLLARSATGSRVAGYIAAVLTAFNPWLVLSTTLLTENAAYPAFVWAVFLCNRAIARPTAMRDVAALAGLLVAFVARTQFFVLAIVLPVALVCHEVAFASSDSNGGSRSGRLRAGARKAVATHRVLFSVYVLGGVVAAALVAHGSLGSVVGNYALPFRGDLFPSGIWRSAAAHLDRIVIGCGVLPFLLAVSWALTTERRSERAEGSAFAWLLLLTIPLLMFEVASFDLRFTPNAFIQDRYLFYLVPLFAVGAGAALVQFRHAVVRAIVAVAVAAIFAWLAGFASYDDDTIIFWASPAAAFHPALVTAAGWLHLSAGSLVRLTMIPLALAAAALCLLPRSIRPGVAVGTAFVIVAFGVFEAGYVFERFAEPAITPASAIPYEAPRDWIDVALRGRGSATLVPSPVDPQPYWWDAEFWNTDVRRVLRVGGGPTFTPFPADDVSVDFAEGRLDGPQPTDFLVVSPNEPRFHLLEAEAHVADRTPLRLVRVVRPYRLAWATQGVTADGWTTPGQAGVLRLYGNGRRGQRTIAVILSAPREAARPVGFTLKGAGTVRRGSVDPGGDRPPVRLDICVPASGYANVILTTSGGARVPDGRFLALHFDRIAVRATAEPCRH
jgi:hypothetical protein